MSAAQAKLTSTPNLLEYDPREIPWQFELIKDIRRRFDYALGTHECLLSGAVGSGKSLPAAHLVVTHCLEFPGSNVGVGRRALPQLKATTLRKIQEHLFNGGVDFRFNRTSGDFDICNGSRITACSWADGNYSKFGSYELSAGLIEEGQENKEDTAHQFLLSRVGRLSHVSEGWLITTANPDSPAHHLAKRFSIGRRGTSQIMHPTDTRHVYFSRTEQNKFLKAQYIDGLKKNMDPKLARRLIYGEWVEINVDRIYSSYEQERNFRDYKYKIDARFPIHLAWDFNIGTGKPLSMVCFQYINDTFHFFNEVVVEGIRTEGSIEEVIEKGLLDLDAMYYINGDATGKNGHSSSQMSDYELIRKRIERHVRPNGTRVAYQMQVPLANPPIRKRHNTMNAYAMNDLGQIRMYVYRDAPTMDEGMRLTSLKKGADYIEDDSKSFQHITTAAGYGVLSSLKDQGRVAPGNVSR